MLKLNTSEAYKCQQEINNKNYRPTPSPTKIGNGIMFLEMPNIVCSMDYTHRFNNDYKNRFYAEIAPAIAIQNTFDIDEDNINFQ